MHCKGIIQQAAGIHEQEKFINIHDTILFSKTPSEIGIFKEALIRGKSKEKVIQRKGSVRGHEKDKLKRRSGEGQEKVTFKRRSGEGDIQKKFK